MFSKDNTVEASKQRRRNILKGKDTAKKRDGTREDTALAGIPFLDSIENEKKELISVTTLVSGDYIGAYEFIFNTSSLVTGRSTLFAECLVLDYRSFEDVIAQMIEEGSDLIMKTKQQNNRKSLLQNNSMLRKQSANISEMATLNPYAIEVKYIGRHVSVKSIGKVGLPSFLNKFTLPVEILLKYMDINEVDEDNVTKKERENNEALMSLKMAAVAQLTGEEFQVEKEAQNKKSFLYLARKLTIQVRLSLCN